MKNLFFLFMGLFLWTDAFSQTNLYENPEFDRIAQEHQEIAIIPFRTSLTLGPLQMRDISTEQLARMEESEGYSIQSAMYSWFLKREKRGSLTVKVQSPTETNAKLKKAGVDYANFEEFTPVELASILNVDAVIMGTFETNKPMSEAASVALGILVGFRGNTNEAILNLSIFDRKEGDLLVNYNKAVSGSMGSSTENLINVLMRKASRRIAYTK